TNYIFQHMETAAALAIFRLSTIVSVFLGYHIFHEKNVCKKIIGSIIMMIGAILIIMYN
ncbi:EamA family transporter, partial [bacterium]|nr:EamA family transporter [bacterium]